jgi:hypothetical protein
MTTIALYHSEGGYEIKLRGDDSEAFKRAIEHLKMFVHGYHRRYDPVTKQWRVDQGAKAYLHRWLACMRLMPGVEIQWLDYEDEESSEWTPPPQEPPRTQPRDAYAALHFVAERAGGSDPRGL